MNDTTQTRRSEIVLGNYIVQKGMDNEELRDEIFCQLVNQTHENPNSANCERGWMLIAACASCFGPSLTLRKPLLKYKTFPTSNGQYSVMGFNLFSYVTNGVGADHLRNLALQKLQMGIHAEGSNSRRHPPTHLEWMGICSRGSLALQTKFNYGSFHIDIQLQLRISPLIWLRLNYFRAQCQQSS